MIPALRGLTALWVRFSAWRARCWLQHWKDRQLAAEEAAARYRLWLVRAGLSQSNEG